MWSSSSFSKRKRQFCLLVLVWSHWADMPSVKETKEPKQQKWQLQEALRSFTSVFLSYWVSTSFPFLLLTVSHMDSWFLWWNIFDVRDYWQSQKWGYQSWFNHLLIWPSWFNYNLKSLFYTLGSRNKTRQWKQIVT